MLQQFITIFLYYGLPSKLTVHFNQNLKRHISRNLTDATDLHASTVFDRMNFSLSDIILMDMMQFVFLCIIGLASLSDVGACPVNGKLKKTSGYLLYKCSKMCLTVTFSAYL